MELEFYKAYWKTGNIWMFFASVVAISREHALIHAQHLAIMNGYDIKRIKVVKDQP